MRKLLKQIHKYLNFNKLPVKTLIGKSDNRNKIWTIFE